MSRYNKPQIDPDLFNPFFIYFVEDAVSKVKYNKSFCKNHVHGLKSFVWQMIGPLDVIDATVPHPIVNVLTFKTFLFCINSIIHSIVRPLSYLINQCIYWKIYRDCLKIG